MKKYGSLIALAGVAFLGIQSSIYCVDHGEKALIMDIFQGLKKKVYG